MNEEPEDKDVELRRSIVNVIVNKAEFNGLSGKTIVQYAKEIEDYIKSGKTEEDINRSKRLKDLGINID